MSFIKEYWKALIITVTILGSGIYGINFLATRYWRKKTPDSRLKKLKALAKNGPYSRLVRRRNLDELRNTNWENVGKVKKLWIYPIKSCAAINVHEVTMEKLGPKVGQARDRSLLIVDDKGEMITGRKVNATVLITTAFDWDNNIITLHYPHLQPLKLYLSLIELEGELCKGTVWNDHVSGIDCGDEVADWLRLALGRTCRLLYHGNLVSSRSTASLISEYPLMNSDDNSLYADLCGCMLLSEESLKDLHNRTSCNLYSENFRGNILVEGSKAYDEDNWTYLKIGGAIFRNVKPCDRCIFTTIDFKTGERDKNMEPLKTMKRYRCKDGSKSPFLGINLGIDHVGKVSVGDEVFVLRD